MGTVLPQGSSILQKLKATMQLMPCQQVKVSPSVVQWSDCSQITIVSQLGTVPQSTALESYNRVVSTDSRIRSSRAFLAQSFVKQTIFKKQKKIFFS